jgi:alpha-glucuronidase
MIDSWQADADLPTKAVDGSSSMRRTISSIELKTGDEIRIQGTPEGGDAAAIDYIEILPYMK